MKYDDHFNIRLEILLFRKEIKIYKAGLFNKTHVLESEALLAREWLCLEPRHAF